MDHTSKQLGKQLKALTERCEAYGISNVSGLKWDPSLTEEQIVELVEKNLQELMQSGNQQAIFILGQYYFEQKQYDKALHYFEMLSNRGDWQAIFQLAVMYYDGLGVEPDIKMAFELMYKVATCELPEVKHLVHAAQYNVGRAYYQGHGVKRSEDEAERFWLLAADDGNPKASVKAQSTLGLFYSCSDHLDLKKAFYWHTEATGNGSIESQGALGVMYMNGLGIKQNEESAYICFREATNRGNIYAAGNLIDYYFKHKLFSKTVELAAQILEQKDRGIEEISAESDCLPLYVKRGLSMAAFYYGRCLDLGRGIQKDEVEAKKYSSLSCAFDPEVCARLLAESLHMVC